MPVFPHQTGFITSTVPGKVRAVQVKAQARTRVRVL